MKLFNKFKRIVRKPVVVATIAAAVFGVAAWSATPASTSAAPGNSDCGNAVYCGGLSSTSDAYNKYNGSSAADKTMRNVYDSSSFGISESDMKDLKANGVVGAVTKSGEVIVNGQVVATGALTAGLEYISGSTGHSNNGTTFYTRPPSVSFLQSSLSAYVDMKDGVFQFAAITSCANPVVAHPKLPDYTITKQVSIAGQGDFKNTLDHIKAGSKVEYKITVSSTGAVADKNITVKDNLPNDITEVANSLTRNDPGSNNTVNGDDKAFFSNGVNIASLAPGQSVVFKFEATVGKYKDTDPQCKAQDLTNTGTINSAVLPAKHASAIVKTYCTPPPTPVYACTNLTDTVSSSDPLTFNFEASAKAENGANNTSFTFDFGDNSSKKVTATSANTAKVSHTYAKAGTYNVKVTANFTVNGKTVSDTGKDCEVTVKPKVPAPQTLVCDKLSSVSDSRTTFTFKAGATATNGATITGYAFSFGDGTTKTVTTSASSAQTNHTYSAPGTYNVTVNVLGTLNGKAVTITSANCATPVTVAPAPAAECTGLTLTAVGDDQFTYTATATYTTSGTAQLTGASFNWGDGTTTTGTNNGNGSITTPAHTYSNQTTSDYTVVATLSFSNGVANSNCSAPVSITGLQPSYSCDELSFTQDDSTDTVTITGLTTSQSNGAAFTGADINWGDGTTDTGLTSPAGQTHQYATGGNYTITAVAHFSVNGQGDFTASGQGCAQAVTFTIPTCTPPQTGTPPNCQTPCTPTGNENANCTPVTPPTTLVNTGAGSVVGLFAAATAVGTLGYRWVLGRRLSREG